MPPAAPWQDALRAAIKARYDSVNGYAKFLAGPGADSKAIGSRRRGIQKWLAVEAPTIPNPTTLAQFRRDGIDFDAALLPTPMERRYRIELLEANQQASLENQQAAIGLLESLVETVSRLEESVRAGRSELESLRSEFEEWRRAG